jgi:ankyrin repeat protein
MQDLFRFFSEPNHNFHSILINCAQSLGYPATEQGLCHGFTMRWIEAMLTNTTEDFFKITHHIQKLHANLRLGANIDELDKNPEWHTLIWNIRPFFESLMLYQSPELASMVLGEYTSQQPLKMSAIASSDAMRDAKGFKESIPLYYGEFKKNDIKPFLELLGKKISSTNHKLPVTFMMSLINQNGDMHAVNIIYNPENKSWLFMDINSYQPQSPPQYESNLDVFINRLPTKNYHCFSMNTILPNTEGIEGFEQQLLETIPTHPNPNYPEYILNLAVNNNDLEMVKKLFQQSHLVLNPTSTLRNSPLFLAIENGHYDILIALLEHTKVELNQYLGQAKATPIFLAAQYGHLKIVKELLKRAEINPNIGIMYGPSPITIAAKHGHLEIVKNFLEHPETDPNAGFMESCSPLFVAVGYGQLEIIQLLLEHPKVDPNLSASNGTTPLTAAAALGNLKIVMAFLEYSDRNPEKILDTYPSPLLVAAQFGHDQVVQALLKQDKFAADLNVVISNGTTPLLIAAQNGHLDVVKTLLKHPEIDPNLTMTDDLTPLYVAVQNNYPKIVKELLQHPRINPNQGRMLDGATPLLAAVYYGRLEIIQTILAHEQIDLNQSRADGITALEIAVIQGKLEVVKLLLEQGAKLNPATFMTDINNIDVNILLELVKSHDVADFNTLMIEELPFVVWALHQGYRDIVDTLIAKGVDVNVKTNRGESALMLAAAKGDQELMKVLIKQGADLNATTVKKESALIIAACQGQVDSVRLLLEHQAIVNDQKTNGDTALILAVKMGYTEIVKLLLDKGADINLQNKQGETALILATNLGSTEMVQALTEKNLENRPENLNKPELSLRG